MLDNYRKVASLDSSRMLESIDLILEQFKEAFYEARTVKIPASFKRVKNIVFGGMGGSALSADVIRSLYQETISAPFAIINGYHLPGFVGPETLFIVSSYSGTTEEALALAVEAKKKGAKIFGITTGSTLLNWLKANKYPYYKIDPKNNPCGQPRMALGYAIGGLLGLFSNCGFIKLTDQEFDREMVAAAGLIKSFAMATKTAANSAKQLAKKLFNRIPFIVAAEFLTGNAHAMANQINENAKNMAGYFVLPEINHHLIEGLVFPKDNSKELAFLLINSPLYYRRNQIRVAITSQIFAKRKIKSIVYVCTAKTKFGQTLEVLLLGSYLSLYLSVLNNINPSPIPMVDYLKRELKDAN